MKGSQTKSKPNFTEMKGSQTKPYFTEMKGYQTKPKPNFK